MAAHRSDDQQRRPGLVALGSSLHEMLEVAERQPQRDLLADRDRLAPDLDRASPNSGLPRGAAAWANTSRLAAAIGPMRVVGERIGGISEPAGAQPGELAGAGQERALHFIGVIKH